MPLKGSLNGKSREPQMLTKDNREFLYIRASTPEQISLRDS